MIFQRERFEPLAVRTVPDRELKAVIVEFPSAERPETTLSALEPVSGGQLTANLPYVTGDSLFDGALFLQAVARRYRPYVR